MQDITPPERVEDDPKCDREVTVYGYLRGANLKPGTQAHLAGVGDMMVSHAPPRLLNRTFIALHPRQCIFVRAMQGPMAAPRLTKAAC